MFDLVGTLVDSTPTVHQALSLVLAGEGLGPVGLEELRPLLGGGSRKLLRRVLAMLEVAPAVGLVDRMTDRMQALNEDLGGEGTFVYPGIPDALDALAAVSVSLAVCSRRPTALTVEELRRFGLADRFAYVSGGEDLARRKPDPRHLLGIIEAVGGSPQATVMVGDRANDIDMAQRAGVRAVLAAYGLPDTFPEHVVPDRIVEHPAELPAAVTALIP